jgi:hypothetical protein
MIKTTKLAAVMFVILSGALLQSCAGDMGKKDHPRGCPDGNPGVVPITINYGDRHGATIMVTGPNQDVFEGDELQFNLVGSDNILVSTSGKTPDAGWLNGSGKKKDGNPNSVRFSVCVPTDLFDGEPVDVQEKDYSYNVDAEGRPTLDPIVPVRRLN